MLMWPLPFTWVPAEGHRHASRDDVPPPGREFPPDMSVTTLCGRQVTTATGEVAWFWPTCFDCDERARALVGVAAREERRPRHSSAQHSSAHYSSAQPRSSHDSSAQRNGAGQHGAQPGQDTQSGHGARSGRGTGGGA
ncbi:hypothetical protein GCM10027174_04620 [Salinifilum aidingensis]